MRAIFWKNMEQVNERLVVMESKLEELEVRLLATELFQVAPKVKELIDVIDFDELDEDTLCG